MNEQAALLCCLCFDYMFLVRNNRHCIYFIDRLSKSYEDEELLGLI